MFEFVFVRLKDDEVVRTEHTRRSWWSKFPDEERTITRAVTSCVVKVISCSLIMRARHLCSLIMRTRSSHAVQDHDDLGGRIFSNKIWQPHHQDEGSISFHSIHFISDPSVMRSTTIIVLRITYCTWRFWSLAWLYDGTGSLWKVCTTDFGQTGYRQVLLHRKVDSTGRTRQKRIQVLTQYRMTVWVHSIRSKKTSTY